MEYHFIFNKKDGWWLKITTPEELLEFWNIYDSVLEHALNQLPLTKEFGNGPNHATARECLIGFHAKTNHISYKEAKHDISVTLKKAQFQSLEEKGAIYINQCLGWNAINKPTEQFIIKKSFTFPKFTKENVKIAKFPFGGKHYYIYIDGILIRDGDTLKWNSYKEAKKFADELIKEEESEIF